MKIAKLSSICLLMTLGLFTVGKTQVHAWSGGVEDPNTQYSDIKKMDEATVPAKGEFKIFDPNDPNTPDPEDPTDWINVKVPASTDFAQTDATPSGVVAPKYKVTNNSVKGVKVSLKNFVDTNTAESAKVPELKLNLAAGGKTFPVVDKGKPVAITVTELATLTKTGAEMSFTYSGNVGSNFQFTDTAVKPAYNLVLQLETVK